MPGQDEQDYQEYLAYVKAKQAPEEHDPGMQAMRANTASAVKLAQGGKLTPQEDAAQLEQSKEAVRAIGGSFVPQGTANPLAWLARRTGLSQVPDKLMQKAVGLKKFIPGVGETLMDEGVVGTKAGMAKQVESKLGARDADLDAAVAKIKGPISSEPVANEVTGLKSRYTTSDGYTPEVAAPEATAVANSAKDIGAREAASPQKALELKRIAAKVGYKEGEPLARLKSELAQAESRGYGQQLERGYAESNPGVPNAVAESNSKLSALMKAKRGLDTPESLTAGSVAGGIVKDAVAGGIGALIGGPGGGVAGMAARRAGSMPVVQSAGAHALRKGAPVAAEAALRTAGSEAMGAQDRADFKEYQDYLKSQGH